MNIYALILFIENDFIFILIYFNFIMKLEKN